MGADIYSLFVDRDRILKNYLCGIINEFYPGQSGQPGYQILKQKQKLTTVSLKSSSSVQIAGAKGSRRELSLRELLEMKAILEAEIQRKKEVAQALKEQEDQETSSYGSDSQGDQLRKSLGENDEEEGKAREDGPVFADFSDSDDEGAELTRNSDYYRADELDIDQKKMRGSQGMGGILNID